MYFRYDLQLLPTTTRSNQAKVVMPVGQGILNTLEISFPPGCASLAHVYISHWEQQLWPWNTDGTFAWDNYTVVIREIGYPVLTEPYRFTMYGWNEDDFYPHKIVCRLKVSPLPYGGGGGWGMMPE